MKVKTIGCTHMNHNEIKNEFVDLLIHTGDASNYRDPVRNESEFLKFWDWWLNYPATYKVFVPGNHDSWLESPMSKSFKKNLPENVYILIDEEVTIEGIKIYGSPRTPNFGNWSFMHDRSKLHKFWEKVPNDTDIFVTHGPPKGILDLSVDRNNKLEFCGDRSLLTASYRVQPKLHVFSHIHNNRTFKNQGVLYRDYMYFANVSCITDGQMGELTSHGIMWEYKNGEICKI